MGLTIGAASILGAHPMLAAGAWPESEAIVAVTLAGAALCLAGIGLAILTGGIKGITLSPLVAVPLAMAAVSALGAPFAAFPGTALLGAPQNGLGAGWFLAQAGFTAAALEMRPRRRIFAGLIAAAGLATSIAVVFNLRHLPWLQPLLAEHGLLPQYPLLGFNEHLAYPALALAALAVVWLGEGRRAGGATLLLLAGLTLVASRNRTAMAAVVLLVPLAALASVGTRGRAVQAWIDRRPKSALLALLAAVLAVGLAPYLAIRFIDMADLPNSLFSRQVLFKVLEPSLFDRPSVLVFGHGWGHYQEYLVRNLPTTGIRLFDPEWADISRDEFHSHSALLEALFAAGLPGLALTLLWPVAVVVAAKRRWKIVAAAFVLAWAAVDSMWFSMPSGLAIQALAAAALAGARVPGGRLPARVGMLVSFGLAALLATGAVLLRHQSVGLDQVRACLLPGLSAEACGSVAIPVDPRGANLGLASLLGEIQGRSAGPLLPRLEMEAEARCRDGCALPLSLQLLNRSMAQAFAKPPATDFSPERWREESQRIISVAPYRLDVLTPYFNWLLTTHDEATLRAVLNDAARINPEHPVVLWFSGIELLGQPTTPPTRGLLLMRRALDAGLERYMPVSDDIKASLRQVQP